MLWYKFFAEDDTGSYSGVPWHMPKRKDRPGKWMPVVFPLSMCSRGYHATTERSMATWIGPRLAIVELKGGMIEHENKVCAEQARVVKFLDGWNEQTQRLFAADCAAKILHIYEKRNKSPRPRKSIQTVRQFAYGQVSRIDLNLAGNFSCNPVYYDVRDVINSCCRLTAYLAASSSAWAAYQSACEIDSNTGFVMRQWQSRRLLAWATGRTTTPLRLPKRP